MSKSRTRRSRKQRRATRAIMQHGRHARPTHKLRAGRTGTLHSKKTPPRVVDES